MTCGFVRLSPTVFVIGDLLHPFDNLAVKRFGNGDVRHRAIGCGAMPMFLSWREPDDVPWTNALDRSSLPLDAAEPGGNQQGLAERMGMPGGPRARFERDGRAAYPCVAATFERRVD